MKLLVVVRYLWASPNTLLGIGIGLLMGAKFRFVDGVWELHSRPLAWALRHMPVSAAAMTLGHVVLGQSADALERTRNHERVHVRQYERWGPFFLIAYLGAAAYLYSIGRDGYRQNPFEIEAYAVDDS